MRELIKKIELARFARSFGVLIDEGVPIFQAIEVAIPVVNHKIIRKYLEPIPSGLREGATLSACMKRIPISTLYLVNTVAIGEESGKLGAAFNEVANFYERESEGLLQTLATLFEPVLILGVGSLVGFIVMGILLPIFEMSFIAQ